MSYESCTYVGNLMADPELRQTKAGKEVCNFVIAVNRFDGSTKKVEVSAWDALAAPAHDHLRKGREVLVAGVVESGHYTDRQGNVVDTLKLTAQVVKFLGSRRLVRPRLRQGRTRRLGWRFQRYHFEREGGMVKGDLHALFACQRIIS